MLFRSTASALFCAFLFVGSTVNAQDNNKPSVDDRKRIAGCVEKERRSDKTGEVCIFMVSERCQQQPGGQSTVGMRECAQRETAIWDDRLNRNYERLRNALSPSGAKKVQDIQRQWIKWRDTKCELSYILFEGGTIAGPLADGCVLKATATRALELLQAVESVGG